MKLLTTILLIVFLIGILLLSIHFSHKDKYTSNFSSQFDIIYCICMPDRKKHMRHFFKQFDITQYEFIEPIKKQRLQKQYTPTQLVQQQYITSTFKRSPKFNYGRIANALSFIKTLKTFTNSPYNSCLILEDDINIPNKNGIQRIHQYMTNLYQSQLPNHWQFVNLGRCWDFNCKNQSFISNNVINNCHPLCTHAISLKKNIASFLLQHTLPLNKPKDEMWLSIIHQNKLWKDKCFCVSPIVFEQDKQSFNSTLSNNHDLRECAYNPNSTEYFFDNSSSKRFLLYSSIGDNHNIKTWLIHHPKHKRSFDVWITYYGDEDDDSFIKEQSNKYVRRKGSKFQNFHDLYKQFGKELKQYDAIWLIDDDILIEPSKIPELFTYIELYNKDIIQPAFDNSGKLSHSITKQKKKSIFRNTNFVEVTCPLFRTSCLIEFMNVYDPVLTCWGVDWWFCSITNKIGIVDCISVINPHDNTKKGREINTLNSHKERIKTWNRVKEKYKLTTWKHKEW